jgi:hypothetical protein
MPVLVRGEHDLPTIRVRLGRSARNRSLAVFEAVRGRGEPVEVDRCGLDELGLPERMDGVHQLDDGAFRLPDAVATRLSASAAELGASLVPPHDAVWLELPNPRGYLHVVPWERLLARLDRPVLRLPNHTVRPQAPASSLEIALCASAPMAKTAFDPAVTLDRLTRLWVAKAGHQVAVHLFTDASGYESLRARTADLGATVTVHDPREAERYDEPERTTRVGDAAAIANPWLLWIRDALRGRALDVLHFVTHGYLSGDRGCIALASTPSRNVDRRLSRFVGAAELSALRVQAGAWALALTGPPYNYSGAGLRDLADAIALAHPGVSLVSELTLDPDGEQLAEAIGMVFGAGAAPSRALPGVTCWVHPSFVEYPVREQDAMLLTPDGRSSLLKASTVECLSGRETPARVAAGTRYLESTQADWLPDTPDAGADSDAVAALESVSALLERHVSRHLGERAGGEGAGDEPTGGGA